MAGEIHLSYDPSKINYFSDPGSVFEPIMNQFSIMTLIIIWKIDLLMTLLDSKIFPSSAEQ